MFLSSSLFMIAAFGAGVANAQFNTLVQQSSATATACADVSSMVSSFSSANPEATNPPIIPPSIALNCLKSVPIDIDRANAFIEYLTPFFEFQSTVAYLKDPPKGYLLPGVDILGGLVEIKKNLKLGKYKNQYSFEIDLYKLTNIKPHEGHFGLQLPLFGIFEFATLQELVSVSDDGIKLPQVYLANDLEAAARLQSGSSWKPSHIVAIDGIPVVDYLSQESINSNAQDPDTLYNALFSSIPARSQGRDSSFSQGGNPFGFSADRSHFTFSNGTTYNYPNVAFLVSTIDISSVTSGEALYSAVEIPKPTPVPTTTALPDELTPTPGLPLLSSSTSAAIAQPTVTGYPYPIVKHSDDYVAGYFLNNTDQLDTAVLAITAFEAPSSSQNPDSNTEMQSVIREFLSACMTAGKTKLIIDLSANGGGSVFNGYDLFKQLFPTIEPFGGSRFRAIPALNVIGAVFTASGVYNASYNSQFQTQSSLDMNLQQFPNWDAEFGPNKYHGDNFTSLLRYNLSDPIQTFSAGHFVSGYGNETVAPQPFLAKNIVMLTDGVCASTCTIFSEMMKSQAGVRSIAVGGRPLAAPMQAVGGTKGVEVISFTTLQLYLKFFYDIISQTGISNASLPVLPSLDAPPLGAIPMTPTSPSFNLRNNYRDGDLTNTPLQFVYEAANCRLFYKFSELRDITLLWNRVANVTWGNGSCAIGSTVNKNHKMPSTANATLPFREDLVAYVRDNSGPGTLHLSKGKHPKINSTSSTTIRQSMSWGLTAPTAPASIIASSAVTAASDSATTSSTGMTYSMTALPTMPVFISGASGLMAVNSFSIISIIACASFFFTFM